MPKVFLFCCLSSLYRRFLFLEVADLDQAPIYADIGEPDPALLMVSDASVTGFVARAQAAIHSVLSIINEPEVRQPVISPVSIDVVNLGTIRNVSHEQVPYQPMHGIRHTVERAPDVSVRILTHNLATGVTAIPRPRPSFREVAFRTLLPPDPSRKMAIGNTL